MTERFIGIRHRVKKTADGDAHPTQVVIKKGEEFQDTVELELKSEQDELDFAFGRLPLTYRAVVFDGDLPDDIGSFPAHHVRWKKIVDPTGRKSVPPRPESHFKVEGDTLFYATHVPDTYDGLREGDTVAMILGGSGDYLAFALARRAKEVGAKIVRIPPNVFKEIRGDSDKDGDAALLATSAQTHESIFYEVAKRDAAVIRVRECFRARMDAMQERIACEQRLRQRGIGTIFCDEKGLYPQGGIEKAFDDMKANDIIYGTLVKEESTRERELTKALGALDIYQALFARIEGCGPLTAARIISAVVDIRRFEVLPDKKFLDESYTRSKQYEQDGKYHEDKVNLTGPFVKKWDEAIALKRWKLHNNKLAEATAIQKCIDEHKIRGKLRRDALNKSVSKVVKYCGAHVLDDGTFPRRRVGQVSNWNPDARQALVLLGEQFNRRPGSFWGNYLLQMKSNQRVLKPEVMIVDGKKRYTGGHIHKMALWRSRTRFLKRVAIEWFNIEKHGYVSDHSSLQKAFDEAA